MAICNAAVFALGGVLIDWDPRRVYRKILPTEVEVEQFLSTVCTLAWDAKQDAGRPLGEGIAELVARFPDRTLLSCSAPQRIFASNFLVMVSPALAIRLAKAFGSSAEVWLGLQMQYDLAREEKTTGRFDIRRITRRRRDPERAHQ